MIPDSYDALARWQSAAGAGPIVRGRHAQGAGNTIHFLSGNGFAGGVYWPMLRRFLPDYGLFTHDIEGHGDSDAGRNYSGTGKVMRRIPLVMAEQGLTGAPLIGMGHSYGGALTLAVAARNPGLFRALVLLDPILLPPPAWWSLRVWSRLGRNPMAQSARRRRDRWDSRDQVIEKLRGRGIYAGWTDETLACFADYATRDADGGRVLSCPREIEAQIFEQPVYPWKLLRRVEVPILFLRGAQSYPFFSWAERLARRANPRVITRQIPGGHCFMQQDPQATHGAVMEFLNSVIPAKAGNQS